jgi:hypothetical protein
MQPSHFEAAKLSGPASAPLPDAPCCRGLRSGARIGETLDAVRSYHLDIVRRRHQRPLEHCRDPVNCGLLQAATSMSTWRPQGNQELVECAGPIAGPGPNCAAGGSGEGRKIQYTWQLKRRKNGARESPSQLLRLLEVANALRTETSRKHKLASRCQVQLTCEGW